MGPLQAAEEGRAGQEAGCVPSRLGVCYDMWDKCFFWGRRSGESRREKAETGASQMVTDSRRRRVGAVPGESCGCQAREPVGMHSVIVSDNVSDVQRCLC